MPNQKRTKIVATLGPATSDKKTLRGMINEGVDVFRINFSHANYDDVKARIKMIRALGKEMNTTTAILGDLQGPKLRVGIMKEEVIVQPGDKISFCTGDEFEGTAKKVYMNYDNFPKDVNPGERILLDDGKLMFEVLETNKKDTVKAKVIQGGPLRSRKGVNLPNTNISLPALTTKDKEDAIFAISQQVDWIALSFVRHADDLKELQALIEAHSEYKIPIIAKIEKPEAVQNIDKIVAYCDGLMVARGDLGVEVPAQEVPLIQKELVLTAKRARIPVIIATQMMETMITSLTPTRAEVNDVANSVMDGADAVMPWPSGTHSRTKSLITLYSHLNVISVAKIYSQGLQQMMIAVLKCFRQALPLNLHSVLRLQSAGQSLVIWTLNISILNILA